MLTPRMKIHFQPTAMAPNGRGEEMGKATARAKMPTSYLNRGLWIGRDHLQVFILEHISGRIWIYNVCGIKDKRAQDLSDDIIFLDPVMTRHFSQFQLMWPHRRSRCSPLWEWWGAFRSDMGQMFVKTGNQMKNWWWDGSMSSGINSIAPIRRPPAEGRLNTLATGSLGTVAMIWRQTSSRHAASGTSQASSWPVDHRIGKR